MRRLGLAVVLSLALVPLAGEAQQAARMPRIGYLVAAPATNPHFLEGFRQGLRDLGYVDGGNIVIEYRSADGQFERLPDVAGELVRLKVDVLVSEGTPPTLAAKQATKTIPIVFAAAADAVGSGIVASLARPGGNVTGLTFIATDLVGEQLPLLREAVPGVTRVAGLWQSGGPGALAKRTQRDLLKATEDAARALAMRLQLIETLGPSDFDKAFSEMTRGRADALIVLTSFMLFNERRHLAELAAKGRLLAVYPWTEAVDGGGLMAYSANLPDLFRRAATYVDKILKGAKPGDLPVEQPTKFEFVINLKTAKALGLTIPQTLLLQADQVIE